MQIDAVPILGIFLATAVVIAAALELGFRLGRRRLRRGGDKSDVSGAMIGAAMGLLAFVMAFTFNAAAQRHEARRMLVLEDASAIEKTWLRAGFLADSERVETRRLLNEYVALRLDVASGAADLAKSVSRFDALHDRLWVIAEEQAAKETGSIMRGLFVESLNDMMDAQLKRLTIGARHRVAPTIWMALYALATLGMVMMGMQSGLAGARQPGIELALALSFSIVLFLIADLDRPQEGLVNVSQQPIIDLQKRLQSQH